MSTETLIEKVEHSPAFERLAKQAIVQDREDRTARRHEAIKKHEAAVAEHEQKISELQPSLDRAAARVTAAVAELTAARGELAAIKSEVFAMRCDKMSADSRFDGVIGANSDQAIEAFCRELRDLAGETRKQLDTRSGRGKFIASRGKHESMLWSNHASIEQRLAAISAAIGRAEAMQYELLTSDQVAAELTRLRDSIPPIDVPRLLGRALGWFGKK